MLPEFDAASAQAPSAITKIVKVVDLWAPEVLGILGAFGIPGAGFAAMLLYKKRQLAAKVQETRRGLEEVVDTIQGAKVALGRPLPRDAKGRFTSPVAVLKRALAKQSPTTTMLVRQAKARNK